MSEATCTALVKGRDVVCSRCGAVMKPEEWWHDDNGRVPFLLWRCANGHITQALPVPAAFRPQQLELQTR